MEHVRVTFHAPAGKLSQEDLNTVYEYLDKMRGEQHKADKPLFMLIDNAPVRPGGELTTNDMDSDFIIRLYGEPRKRIK